MKEWIGFDLDGTLAEYTNWKGIEHIGKPIAPMIRKLQDFLDAGYTVKIVTARVSQGQEAIPYIHRWLIVQGLPTLEITHKKDYGMLTCYDDRCVQVETNTGKIIGKEII